MLLTAALAGTYGLLAAGSLAARAPGMRADRALVLSALAAFVAPLWILGLISTPPMAATRRLLGESTGSTLRASVGAAARVALAMAAAPAGVALGALAHPEAAPDLLRSAALLGCGAVGAGLFAIYALAAAMDTISRGTADAWRAMSGGGAFGPPETTPLLYAPAMAFVLSLMPAALLAAIWGAKAELLPPDRALMAMGAVWLIGAVGARRRVARLAARARRAWLIVEQAHATPFASAEDAPEAPGWLMIAAGDRPRERGALKLLARSWVRRFPGSAVATVALAGVATLSLSQDDPWWLVTAVCGAVTLYSGTRSFDLPRVDEGVAGAAHWLGVPHQELKRAHRRLGLGLLLPSVALLAVGWSTGAWLAAIVGMVGGALAAVGLMRAPGGHSAVVWLGRAGLALALVASAAAGGPAHARPPLAPPDIPAADQPPQHQDDRPAAEPRGPAPAPEPHE